MLSAAAGAGRPSPTALAGLPSAVPRQVGATVSTSRPTPCRCWRGPAMRCPAFAESLPACHRRFGASRLEATSLPRLGSVALYKLPIRTTPCPRSVRSDQVPSVIGGVRARSGRREPPEFRKPVAAPLRREFVGHLSNSGCAAASERLAAARGQSAGQPRFVPAKGRPYRSVFIFDLASPTRDAARTAVYTVVRGAHRYTERLAVSSREPPKNRSSTPGSVAIQPRKFSQRRSAHDFTPVQGRDPLRR